MKVVIQRSADAAVRVDGEVTGRIERGAVVLVGIARGDTEHDVRFLARKTSQLRIYDDEQGRLNASIQTAGGAFLVISQFTLYGDCSGGNRPSYIEAAPPDEARRLYEAFVSELRTLGHEVQTGIFGGNMVVELANVGPVTLIMESRGRKTR